LKKNKTNPNRQVVALQNKKHGR